MLYRQHWLSILVPLAALTILLGLGGSKDLRSQPPQDQLRTLRVIVSEEGVSQPVSDAEVSVNRVASTPAILAAGARRVPDFAGKTDISGQVEFPVADGASYAVSAKKPGYSAAPGTSSTITIAIKAESHVNEVKLGLVRPASLRGRLVDAETGEALTGVKVLLVRRRYVAGRTALLPDGSTITNPSGVFEFSGLVPAEYLLRVFSRMLSEAERKASGSPAEGAGVLRLIPEPSDVAAPPPDWDYEGTYLPGRADLGDAVPFPVVSGQSADMGSLSVRRIPVRSIHVKLTGECSADTNVSVNVVPTPTTGPSGTFGEAGCGEQFVLRGFPRGEYRLEFASSEADRKTAFTTVFVGDNDARVAVHLQPGLTVQGRIVPASQSTGIDVAKARPRLQPVGWAAFGADLENRVRPDGTFQLQHVSPRRQALVVDGLDPGVYVESIRFRGQTVEAGVLDFALGGDDVTVVLNNQVGSISGMASGRDDSPVADAVVLLLPAGVQGESRYSLLRQTFSTPSGEFEFTSLPPGAYLTLAIPRSEQQDLQKPFVLDRIIPSAVKIDLSPRGAISVRLPVREVR